MVRSHKHLALSSFTIVVESMRVADQHATVAGPEPVLNERTPRTRKNPASDVLATHTLEMMCNMTRRK